MTVRERQVEMRRSRAVYQHTAGERTLSSQWNLIHCRKREQTERGSEHLRVGRRPLAYALASLCTPLSPKLLDLRMPWYL